MKRSLSIRTVLVSLGALSILIATGLAGFGLLGMKQQLEAREHVLVLQRALENHNSADAFMDSVRTDVLRALQNALGANKEGENNIRSELAHHMEVLADGINDNRALPLSRKLREDYEQIASILPSFIAAGQAAVELALTDPVAGSANFEHFRRGFSALELLMDEARQVLQDEVKGVRAGAARTAAHGKTMIVTSVAVGALLLCLITFVAVKIAQGITTDLASSREEAHRLALHDTLTGLPNRAFLAERLEQELARVRREPVQLAMLCLDLDRFKQVNDTLGHPLGDALLRAVAGRLRDCVRRSDTVARLGGDEFAVIQSPLSSEEEAGQLGRRIVTELSEPYDLGEHQVVIGASVGLALAPADTVRADMLLKMADMALYRAKADGKGTFRFFTPEMDHRLQARRMLELDLRRAVRMEEFVLHFQPVMNVASGKVSAMEALVRWQHPEQGLVRPDEFIPLAEETGLIAPIGAWVLKQACAEAAAWPEDVGIAVNISAAQFKAGTLVETVAGALRLAGLPARRLELEITETALLADTDATLETLRELRRMGVRIVMDDFGTGYSSLGYLRSFQFDKIKIDRSFIADIETSIDCKAIVRAVTSLGASLGIATTAEGVETTAQFGQLVAEGCDQVQGYLFSRPVPAGEVAALLTHRKPSLSEYLTAAA